MPQNNPIKHLENLDKAKLLVVSDSHGRPQNLETAVRNFGKDCDALVFLGDGIEDLVQLVELNYNLSPDEKFLPPAVFFCQRQRRRSRCCNFNRLCSKN